MPSSFPRTLAALSADGHRRASGRVLLGALVLAAWVVWAVVGRVTLFERVPVARVEVDLAARPVDAPVSGRLRAWRAELGQETPAGAILCEFDDTDARLALANGRTALDQLVARRTAAEVEIAAQRFALEALAPAQAGEVAEAQAKVLAKRREFDGAEQRAGVAEGLAQSRTGTLEEARRARSVADELAAEVATLERAVDKLAPKLELDQRDRLARIAALEGGRVLIDGEIARARGELERLEHQVELHVVRAPVAGRVAAMEERREGSVVELADRLLVLVPRGEARVVADVDAALAGRLEPGQRARLVFEHFPWTRFGFRHATVTTLGNASRGGFMTAYLAVDATESSTIPLEHGLVCSAEIEVEQVAPFELVLRFAGRLLEEPR